MQFSVDTLQWVYQKAFPGHPVVGFMVLWLILQLVLVPPLFIAWTRAVENVAKQAQASRVVAGNLKARTLYLAREIMADLEMGGWPNGYQQWPEYFAREESPEARKKYDEKRMAWANARWEIFSLRSLPQVLEIREEFARIHLRDQKLDDIIRSGERTAQANEALRRIGQPQTAWMPARDVQEVAERLTALANEIQ